MGSVINLIKRPGDLFNKPLQTIGGLAGDAAGFAGMGVPIPGIGTAANQWLSKNGQWLGAGAAALSGGNPAASFYGVPGTMGPNGRPLTAQEIQTQGAMLAPGLGGHDTQAADLYGDLSRAGNRMLGFGDQLGAAHTAYDNAARAPYGPMTGAMAGFEPGLNAYIAATGADNPDPYALTRYDSQQLNQQVFDPVARQERTAQGNLLADAISRGISGAGVAAGKQTIARNAMTARNTGRTNFMQDIRGNRQAAQQNVMNAQLQGGAYQQREKGLTLDALGRSFDDLLRTTGAGASLVGQGAGGYENLARLIMARNEAGLSSAGALAGLNAGMGGGGYGGGGGAFGRPAGSTPPIADTGAQFLHTQTAWRPQTGQEMFAPDAWKGIPTWTPPIAAPQTVSGVNLNLSPPTFRDPYRNIRRG